MSLRDELSAHMRKSGGDCAVRTMLESAQKQRTEIEELLNDPKVPASALTRLLQSHGFNIGHHSVTRHRRKECCCDNA